MNGSKKHAIKARVSPHVVRKLFWSELMGVRVVRIPPIIECYRYMYLRIYVNLFKLMNLPRVLLPPFAVGMWQIVIQQASLTMLFSSWLVCSGCKCFRVRPVAHYVYVELRKGRYTTRTRNATLGWLHTWPRAAGASEYFYGNWGMPARENLIRKLFLSNVAFKI